MESLQLSQVLADLSNLGAAEPEAAAAIVSANVPIIKGDYVKTEPSTPPSQSNRPSTAMKRSWSHEAGFQPKYDKYGRRIFLNAPRGSRPGSNATSTPGTPLRNDSDVEDEMERASTLMALYDIRTKLKQQDNSSLLRAREKINALAAKQQQQAHQASDRSSKSADDARKNRYAFPKPGL